jgi:superfamily II DNA or RNA helicase
MLEPRNYQIELIADFDRLTGAGPRSVLMTAPTGSGKSVITSAIVARAAAAGQRVLAHRREIIDRTMSKLRDDSIGPEVIQAGFADDPGAAHQVPGVQPLLASLDVWQQPTGSDQRARGAV